MGYRLEFEDQVARRASFFIGAGNALILVVVSVDNFSTHSTFCLRAAQRFKRVGRFCQDGGFSAFDADHFRAAIPIHKVMLRTTGSRWHSEDNDCDKYQGKQDPKHFFHGGYAPFCRGGGECGRSSEHMLSQLVIPVMSFRCSDLKVFSARDADPLAVDNEEYKTGNAHQKADKGADVTDGRNLECNMTAILADSDEPEKGREQVVLHVSRCGNAAVETMCVLVLLVGAPIVFDAVLDKFIALGAAYLISAIHIIDPIGIRVACIVGIHYFVANTANPFVCAIDRFIIVIGRGAFSANCTIHCGTAYSFPAMLGMTLSGLTALFAVIDMTSIRIVVVKDMFAGVVDKTIFGSGY